MNIYGTLFITTYRLVTADLDNILNYTIMGNLKKLYESSLKEQSFRDIRNNLSGDVEQKLNYALGRFLAQRGKVFDAVLEAMKDFVRNTGTVFRHVNDSKKFVTNFIEKNNLSEIVPESKINEFAHFLYYAFSE